MLIVFLCLAGPSCLATLSEGATLRMQPDTAHRQHLVLEALFEDSNFHGWKELSVNRASFGTLTIDKGIKKAGGSSARFEILKVKDQYRAELGINPRQSLQEGWYGISYYIPPETQVERHNDYDVISQWQAPPDIFLGEKYRSPPLSIDLRDYNFRVSWRSSGQPVTKQGDFTYDFATVPGAFRGQWHDFVFHVKWGYAGNGILEVWHNGQKVVDKTSISIGYNDLRPPYFKCGIYKPAWRHTGSSGNSSNCRVLYIDNVRIGNERADYKDVKP